MADYPTPLHGGPRYQKFTKMPKDWASVTDTSVFEDQSVDFQKSAADAPQIYELIYSGRSETEAKILDDFWDAHGIDTPFTFYEPRNYPWTGAEGSTVTNCYFKSYKGDHARILTSQSRVVEIIHYPS